MLTEVRNHGSAGLLALLTLIPEQKGSLKKFVAGKAIYLLTYWFLEIFIPHTQCCHVWICNP